MVGVWPNWVPSSSDIYIEIVYAAGITGHWKSSVTENEFRSRLQTINSPEITNPTVRFK